MATNIGACQGVGGSLEFQWGAAPFTTTDGSMLVNVHEDAFPVSYHVTTASDMNFLTDEFVVGGLFCKKQDLNGEYILDPIDNPLWYRISIILEETTIDLENAPSVTPKDEFLFPEGIKLKYKTDGTWKYEGVVENIFKWVPELQLPPGAKFDNGDLAGGNYFTYYNAGSQFYRFTWKLMMDIYQSEEDFLSATPSVTDASGFLDAVIYTDRSEYELTKGDTLSFTGDEEQQSLMIVKSPNTFRDFFIQTYPTERKELELAFGISKLEEYDVTIVDGEEEIKYYIVDGKRVSGKDYLQYLLDNGYIRRFT